MKTVIKVLHLLFWFCCTTKIEGQTNEHRISLSIGPAYSYLTNYENSRMYTYSTGLQTDVLKFDDWGLYTGIFFQNKGGENIESYQDREVVITYQYYQYSVPVILFYRLGKKLILQAGIYCGWNIPYKMQYDMESDIIKFISQPNDKDFDGHREIRKLENGSKIGLEFTLFKNFSLELTIAHAFLPFYIDQPSSNYLILTDKNAVDLNLPFKRLLDHKMKNSKNAFYCLAVKVDLFKY